MSAVLAMSDVVSMRERLALLQRIGAPPAVASKSATDAPGGRVDVKRPRRSTKPKLHVVPSVTAVPLPPAAPPQPAPARPPFDWLKALTIAVAVVLGVVAAGFSICGMAHIFPGASIWVQIMDGAMEAGKLLGVAFLSRHWRQVSLAWRLFLFPLLVVLAVINAIGVFGQLSEAHRAPSALASAAIGTRSAISESDVEAQASVVVDLNTRIAQSDALINEVIRRGRMASGAEQIRLERVARAKLVEQRSLEQEKLSTLRGDRARLLGESEKVAADIGVLAYAASVFGIPNDVMISWTILGIVLCLDPLSLGLMAASAVHALARKS